MSTPDFVYLDELGFLLLRALMAKLCQDAKPQADLIQEKNEEFYQN
jgi:hypothetical protein